MHRAYAWMHAHPQTRTKSHTHPPTHTHTHCCRWKYNTWVNYDFFPSKDFPILVYFKETQVYQCFIQLCSHLACAIHTHTHTLTHTHMCVYVCVCVSHLAFTHAPQGLAHTHST